MARSRFTVLLVTTLLGIVIGFLVMGVDSPVDKILNFKQGDELVRSSQKIAAREHGSHTVEICNSSDQELIYATLAYFDKQNKAWTQKGWFSISRGKCTTPLHDGDPPFYGFVESSQRHMEWGSGGDGPRFCIHANDRFTYKLKNCLDLATENSLVRWQTFSQLDVSEKGGTFRWDIDE